MPIKDSIRAIADLLPGGCRLIAVTKFQPTTAIEEAYEAGQRLFGENKAQELVGKHEGLPDDIAWHMIGHLQRNKVKYIAPFVSLIHSIDSLRLLEEVNKEGAKHNRVIPCLLQVHIAMEDTKFGFSEEEILELPDQLNALSLSNVAINGLMGMATFTGNEHQVHTEFEALNRLFTDLRQRDTGPLMKMEELSMGMSNDFRIAIEHGSTLVRVGTAIFGERAKP